MSLLPVLGLLSLLGSAAWGMGPFQKNADEVAKGMSAYAQGHWKEALKHFEAAKKKHPDSPEVDLDRGNALYQLKRWDDAKAAYGEALKAAPGKLSEKSYYDLGNAWARLKKRDQAIAAFRHALTLDPKDEQARHNLEVMLERIPPKKKRSPNGKPKPNDGGTDAGQPMNRDGGSKPQRGRDGGSAADGGSDGGTNHGQGGGDAGTDAGTSGQGRGSKQHRDAGSGQQKQQPQNQSAGEDAGTDGGTDAAQEKPSQMEDGGVPLDPKHMSKKDALRMLNAMKQNEKSLQLWKFQEQGKHPRRAHEKDW